MIISLSKYNLEGCMDPISNIFLQCQFGLLFERGKSILFPPVLHYSEAPWCHAVDTPVGDALFVKKYVMIVVTIIITLCLCYVILAFYSLQGILEIPCRCRWRRKSDRSWPAP